MLSSFLSLGKQICHRELSLQHDIFQRNLCQKCEQEQNDLGINYTDVADKSDDEVYLLFFPDKFHKETVYSPVNYEHIHSELKKTGVTLKLLWQKYKEDVKVR